MRYCFASWVTTKGTSPFVSRKSSQVNVTWPLTVAPAAGVSSVMGLDFFWKALALLFARSLVGPGPQRDREALMQGRTNQKKAWPAWLSTSDSRGVSRSYGEP